MPDPSLPVRSTNHKTGTKGVSAARIGVQDSLGWIFREQLEDDYGIDAHLEVVTADDDLDVVTGQLIGAQIKGGKTQKRRAKGRDGWYYYSTKRSSLNYWLGHTLPVIIVVYDEDSDTSYWQVVRSDLVEYTDKGFKVFVPRSQPLNDSCRHELEEVAKRTGQRALEVFDRSLDRLPESVVIELRRAAGQDVEGAARVAQILADGSAQPGMTASHLLGAQPTWLIGSSMAEALWAAVAGFAGGHLEHDLTARAFLVSAACGGPYADRRRALAALSYVLAGDRDEARKVLELVAADNARLLAAVGWAALSVPENDARPIPTPEAITTATDDELNREPTVLNFLAENASRRGDVDDAVALAERAVSSPRGTDPQMKVRIAELLRRRMQSRGGFGGQDSRAARDYARRALEDMRRWSGPSHLALSELLDMEILDGMLRRAVRMALPATAGGTATDREAAEPAIARKGAVAALMSRADSAEAVFRQMLVGNPWLDVLDAQRLELHGGQDTKNVWLKALRSADDEASRSICASRLAEMGVWPLDEVEDMAARSVMPSWTYRILQAKANAAQGRTDEAVRQLRILAEDNATGAMELIRLLDQNGDPSVSEECELQYQRWHDGMLIDLMLHLSVPDPDAEGLWTRFMDDPRLSPDTASGLRRRLISTAGQRGDWRHVADLCERGLATQPSTCGNDAEEFDTELAWQAAGAYLNLHDMPRARDTVTRHRLVPIDEDTARLWVRLRVSTDFTQTDIQLAVELAEQYGRSVAEPVSSLLVRESNRSNPERDRGGPQPWPQPLRDRAQAIITAAQAAGYGPESISKDELIRRLEQTDTQDVDRLRRDAQAGRMPLGRFASRARRPYGQLLLQRALGITVAADIQPGLNTTGQRAAAAVLARAKQPAGLLVADLSALSILELLAEHGRDLRARLPQMVVTESTKIDAIATRDAVWAITGASFTAGLDSGRLVKETLDGAERARLRELATGLEDAAARLAHQAVECGTDPAFDSLALAADLRATLYADDVALRQRARAQSVATFGTADLIAATAHPEAGHLMSCLAEHGVVDLPLDAQQIIALECRAGWAFRAGALALSRSHWWHDRMDWVTPWKTIAAAAADHAPASLTAITQAALTGSIADVSTGEAPRRYLLVVVAALEAAHSTGSAPTPDYLTQLASRAADGLAPSLKTVFHTLRESLTRHGDTDAASTAAALLTIDVTEPSLWT
ncbi:DUF4365 domain-containing protein [Spirillospora sp. NPDC048911]|uniref:DUF4365 domain-containing protein n=1 Tax=Spirillospora sp. NPDC048911 TaxID=3364527 RepID=UPI00371287E6